MKLEEKEIAELAAILRKPILRKALDICVSLGYAHTTPGSDLNAHALANSHREGYFIFYKNLLSLGDKNANQEKNIPLRAWDYLRKPIEQKEDKQPE